MASLLILIALFVCAYGWLVVLPRFGAVEFWSKSPPSRKSKHYHAEKSAFVNSETAEKAIAYSKSKINYWELIQLYFKRRKFLEPGKRLPTTQPNFDLFHGPHRGCKFIWFGHSSFLVTIEGVNILVDPVFENFASPLDFVTRRYQSPVVSRKDLPRVDVVLISHDHYDHLEKSSVDFFSKTRALFVVPLKVGRHLRRWGVKEGRIVELDWWETYRYLNVELTAAPAQHFSGRILPFENRTLWCSWRIKSQSFNLFYSGDSGYGPHFKEIGEKLGPFDLTFLECGQYHKAWPEVHLLPQKFRATCEDLKTESVVPVHWAAFTLSLHPWQEPVEKLVNLLSESKIRYRVPLMGETVDLVKEWEENVWWRSEA